MNNSSFDYVAPNSNKINTVDNFHSICVDDFFSNPDKIRNWGLSLEKQPDPDGRWPGVRSKPLHEVNPQFSNELILKVMCSYIDLKYHNISWGESVVCFQEITPFKNEIENIGWIHRDGGMQLAFIIYLTPNADVNSGTSLYNLKNTNSIIPKQYQKEKLFKGEKIDDEEYKTAVLENQNLFYEKNRFQNIYNRMIAYDASEFHRANNFTTNTDKRLTLVGFVTKIQIEEMPLEKIRNYGEVEKSINVI